jgi:mycothiol synthase
VAEIRDATPEDAEQIYELLDTRSRAAVGISEVSREGVAAELRRLGVDRWVAVEGGKVVGYTHLTSTQELVQAAVDSTIGDRLFSRAVDRARELGFDRIEAIVLPEDAPFDALVRRRGFAHERDVLRMWRMLDDPIPPETWPGGAVVRSYRDTDAQHLHQLLDETYATWDTNYVPQHHDEWLQFMTDHDEFDPELWFLVERDGRLVACALHWKEHQRRGWVKDIVVRESERGRGLGRALLVHGFHAYASREVERVGLKVDSTNPTGAIQLYESLGFRTDRRYGIWNKQL